ncbi:isochorismatase family protein [Lichenicoccus sp.]|uniref:isochorismatase family protein n=1 Tax=Lichenicoccus sp. TaxID=2781899 RepID=UPI003D0BEAAF
MSIATLDPTTALVIIDLQKGIAAYPTIQPLAEVVGHAADLARAFREQGLPVVLVNVAGGAPGRTEQARRTGELPPEALDLLPELCQDPQDIVITKRSWGAFTSTGLEQELRRRGVTQIVLAGVSTSIGVDTTARQAFDLGFNVTLAVDAMTDTSAEAHTNSVDRIFPRLGETGTVAEIVALLDRAGA